MKYHFSILLQKRSVLLGLYIFLEILGQGGEILEKHIGF